MNGLSWRTIARLRKRSSAIAAMEGLAGRRIFAAGRRTTRIKKKTSCWGTEQRGARDKAWPRKSQFLHAWKHMKTGPLQSANKCWNVKDCEQKTHLFRAWFWMGLYNYKNCLLVLHACFSSLHREVLRFEDSKRASVRKVVCLLTICRPRVTKKIDAERSKRKSMRTHRDY